MGIDFIISSNRPSGGIEPPDGPPRSGGDSRRSAGAPWAHSGRPQGALRATAGSPPVTRDGHSAGVRRAGRAAGACALFVLPLGRLCPSLAAGGGNPPHRLPLRSAS